MAWQLWTSSIFPFGSKSLTPKCQVDRFLKSDVKWALEGNEYYRVEIEEKGALEADAAQMIAV